MLDSLIDLISDAWWTYPFLFAFALLDSVIPIIPSETAVIAAGLTIAPGAYVILSRNKTAAISAKVPSGAIVYEYGTGLPDNAGIILANGATPPVPTDVDVAAPADIQLVETQLFVGIRLEPNRFGLSRGVLRYAERLAAAGLVETDGGPHRFRQGALREVVYGAMLARHREELPVRRNPNRDQRDVQDDGGERKRLAHDVGWRSLGRLGRKARVRRAG